MAELLLWPALLGYGEATVALLREMRSPGVAGRLAIWGVRLGWLFQSALLVVQAGADRSFPWTSWAGALNLFVWLVVTAYLAWGSRPAFRLVGLGMMPVAALALGVAAAGGGADVRGDDPGTLLAVHVALMLIAFAGLTLVAALAALFLWQERRLKRRAPGVLRVRVPPLASLERLSGRAALASVATLTLGIALGAASLARDGGGLDAGMAAALAAWAVYAGVLVLHRGARLVGRRAALVQLAGYAAVVASLSLAHFA